MNTAIGMTTVSTRCSTAWKSRRVLGAGALFLLLALTSSSPAQTPTFVSAITNKAQIAQPSNEFVKIYCMPRVDGQSYGFRTDGGMTTNHWMTVLNRVGHLHPYADVNPYYGGTWDSSPGSPVGLTAAEAIGRETAGCICKLPVNTNEAANISALYNDAHGLQMSTFFHDAESYDGVWTRGTPGASGYGRLLNDHSIATNNAPMATDVHSDFDYAYPNGRMRSFVVSFGIYMANYYAPNAVGGVRIVHSGNTTNGWRIDLYSEPVAAPDTQSYNRTFRFNSYLNGVVQTATSSVLRAQNLYWLTVTVVADTNPSDSSKLNVQVNVEPAGLDTIPGQIVAINRPGVNGAGNALYVGGEKRGTVGAASHRWYEIDDLSVLDKDADVIAAYDFEPATPGEITSIDPIGNVADLSGLGHTLYTPAGQEDAFVRFPTHGVEPVVKDMVQDWLVDEMLAARTAHGKPDPDVIANWYNSVAFDSLTVWKSVGMTHGNASCYWGNPTLATNDNKVSYLIRCVAPLSYFAWSADSNWSSLWIGNVNRTNGLVAADYNALVSLLVLQGTRWFLAWPSNGHMGDSSVDGNAAAMATANADCLYAMCEAAACFQSTPGLAESELTEEKYGDAAIGADTVYLRRDKASTKEVWFAGLKVSGATNYTVSLPTATGTVRNLKTGAITAITNGVFGLSLGATVAPYYFDGGSSGGKPFSYWKLDNNANDATGTNAGTACGGYVYNTGIDGQCITLVSSGYVDCGAGFEFDKRKSFSVALWAKRSTTNSLLADMISKGYTQGWEFRYWNTTTPHFRVADTNSQAIASFAAIADTNWHHFVGVVDRASRKIYAYTDGVFVSSYPIPEDYDCMASDWHLNIGRLSQYNLRYFPGSIDDVRIYARALTAKEVADIRIPGLVGHYALNGGVADNAGVSDGVAAGGFGYGAGKEGLAAQLDGTNDYIKAGNPAAFNFGVTDSFSIALWAKRSNTNNVYADMISKCYNQGWEFRYWATATPHFRVANTNGQVITPFAAINNTNWHHFVGVVDRANLKICAYTDGALTSSQAIPASYDVNAAGLPVNIGCHYSSRYFPGSIDDVRIYRLALTTNEIQTLYNFPNLP